MYDTIIDITPAFIVCLDGDVLRNFIYIVLPLEYTEFIATKSLPGAIVHMPAKVYPDFAMLNDTEPLVALSLIIIAVEFV